MSKNDLIQKAAETLDEARTAADAETRDSLTRVAQGYTTLATVIE